jgi:tripartite-type tricarboxylate transporter receptor subunit TctC
MAHYNYRVRPLFLAWAILFATTVGAQEWPQKAVRIIVPFPAGGSADLLPRYVGEKLSQQWGQPVIVDNRPGAAGNIGATAVFQAEPDGYTLLSAPPPPLVINRLLYPKLAYDSTQFVPMTVIAAIPNVLLVNPKVTARSVGEFVALVKGNPGKLNYASQGNGTTSHLTAELFKSMAGGLDIAHVPYKGTAPALADLLGGQVDLMFDNLGVSLPHVRSGKLKALAVASRKRVASLPDTPTIAESLPGFEAVAWFGIVGPPKTPSAIAEKVAAGVAEALKNPDVLRRLGDMAAEPLGLTPAETAAFMKLETERWSGVIRSANVRIE